MRKGASLGLLWDRVDFQTGCTRLKGTNTKNSEGRSIPIGRESRQVLHSLPLAVDIQRTRVPYMLTRNGQPIKSIREIFKRVCQETGFTNVVLDDHRHAASTTLKRAGVDALTAMNFTGHKTLPLFKRYNTIDEDDRTVAQRQVDTSEATRPVRRRGKTASIIEK
jgi:integrase